ncbi:hypothetical protein GZ78_10205 [Endozoicomonas numazuensis]|uniref:Toxin CptA n=2 Tax=Endozoicomonas numazuensis TaxID=1137799 RepID=A0A081NHQ3_9GAMM|nr:hypothetical protein GZ78_10205 [Endozoicomonas numazuensis]
MLSLFCYLLAVLALLCTSLNWLYSFCLLAALTVYSIHYYRLRLNKSLGASVLAVRWHNHRWFIETRAGWQPCWPKGEWLVLPWLMCLSFRGEDERNYSVNFFKDSDDPEALHALRLRLILMGKSRE